MTDKYGLSPPIAGDKDWVGSLSFDRLRNGRRDRAQDILFKKHNFGAFLSLNEWNTRYISSTYTPAWTTGNSGLRYALWVKGDPWPIVYEQGEIGYHTERSSPWLPKGYVKYAVTGMGWIARCMGEAAHKDATKRFVDQIYDELKRGGVQNEVLALDFNDPSIDAAFQARGVKTSSEGYMAMLEARKLKLPEEVACLRNTCVIGDAMFACVARHRSARRRRE